MSNLRSDREALRLALARFDEDEDENEDKPPEPSPRRAKLPRLAPCPRGKKRCRRCNKAKKLSLFYRKKQAKDGRQERCKACDAERDKVREYPALRGPPKQFICRDCASLPHRVTGRKCKKCGLKKGPPP